MNAIERVRYSPKQVAKIFGVVQATVIAWVEDGSMPAVDVASASASRRRWRMSDEDIQVFEEKRRSKTPPAREPKQSRRTIVRPTKDFFAKTAEVSR